MDNLVNLDNLVTASQHWGKEKPFPHTVIDSFFKPDVARALESEFPSFDDDVWHIYNNSVEVKKLCNSWDRFPPTTYKVLSYLNSTSFAEKLSELLLGGRPLVSDMGLNGGGWHIHSTGGKLNPHLDYSLHPKLGLQRKLNIIIYLNAEWHPDWGGSLGLWGNESTQQPGDLIKEIEPKFNRAAVFDTTQNSWHGLSKLVTCPPSQCRKSLAVYYLCEPDIGTHNRGKALFAPTEEQKNDPDVRELIKKRSQVDTASQVYRKG